MTHIFRQGRLTKTTIVTAIIMGLALSQLSAGQVLATANDEAEILIPLSGAIMVTLSEDPEGQLGPKFAVVTPDNLVVSVSGEGLEEAENGDQYRGQIVVNEQVLDQVHLAEPDVELNSVTLEQVQDSGAVLEGRDVQIYQGEEGTAVGSGRSIDVVWLGGPGSAKPADSDLRSMTEKSVNYWVNQSAGKIPKFTISSIGSAVVAGNVPGTEIPLFCDYNASRSLAIKATGTYSYFASEGRSLLVVTDRTECNQKKAGVDYEGMANLGANLQQDGFIWMRVEVNNSPRAWNVLAHEIGHNLGLGHSNTLDCDDQRGDAPTDSATWDPQWACKTSAYRDYYDVMGIVIFDYLLPALNVSHKIQLGFLNRGSTLQTVNVEAGNKQTVVLSGTSATTGVQGVEIVDPLTGETILVEYRDGQGTEIGSFYTNPSFYDWTSRIGTGVRFSRSTPYYFTSVSTLSQRQRSGTDSALWYGQGDVFNSYSRSLNDRPGISVKVISAKGASATLQVTFDNATSTFTKIPTPTVVGNGFLNSHVSVAGAVWEPAAKSLAYQWLLNGKSIPGANQEKYLVTPADCKQDISVRIEASQSGYADSAVTTNSVNGVCPVETRLGAATRYDTAVSISKEAFPTARNKTLFISTGESFPDALAAAPNAATNDAPLLLVPSAGALPNSVVQEIKRLSPSRVVVVGGVGSISEKMVEQIRNAAGKKAVIKRISGNSRYETAQKIALSEFPNGSSEVFIATGRSYPDALSVSAAAGGRGAAVILIDGRGDVLDELALSTIAGLHPEKVYIVGGPGSISANIEKAIKKTYPAVIRLSGANRYETSLAINQALFNMNKKLPEVKRQYWATGSNYPDALAGAAAAAKFNAPLYVIPPNCVPKEILAHLGSKETSNVFLLGGENALSAAVQNLTVCQ